MITLIFKSLLCGLTLILLLLLSDSAWAKDNLINLELNQANIRSILQLLAEKSHLNMILTDDIQGTITLNIKQVTWSEALNLVVKTKGLSQRTIGKTIWIAKTSDVMKQEKQDWQAQQQSLEQLPLTTKIVKIYYAKASDIANIIKEKNNSILSSRGHILADDRIHLLWINDTAHHIELIEKLIHKMDVPLKQIMIEARIANVDRSFERNLGLRFGASKQAPNSDDNDSEKPMMRISPLEIGKNASPFGLFVVPLVHGIALDVELTALENEGKGEFISNPKLLTQDQKTATIQAGEEIPFQERTRNGSTTIAFKKAVLSLEVTPRVLPGKQLQLDLKVNQDAPGIRLSDGFPMIDTRQIETHVQVRSGETFVLGGILEESKHRSVDKVPFLSQIPLLGKLFQSDDRTGEQRELLIFITPTIVE